MSSPVPNTNKKLYDRNLNFHHKESSMEPSSDILRLNLSLEWQNSNSFHNKEILINLTDPVDPFFIYHLVLKGDDFLSLKQEQGLLVDFLNFPQSFIDLLSMCQQEDERREARYLLQLTNHKDSSELNAVTIEVVETNKFKLLTHLSLKLVSPSEFVIKRYLTSCFREIKDENDSLKSKVGQLQQELKKQIDSYSRQQQEFNSFKENSDSRLSSKEYEFQEKLRRETQQLMKSHKTEMDMLALEQKRKESQLLSSVDDYIARISEFEQEIEGKNSQICSLRSSVKELKSQLQASKMEQLRMDTGVAMENKNLISKMGELNRQLQISRDEAEDLQKLLDSREKDSSELINKVRAITERKVSLDEIVSRTTIELNKSKEMESVLKSDIVKANDIIRKFQVEARGMNITLKGQSNELSRLQYELHQREELLSEQARRCSYFENIVKPQKEKIELLAGQINNLRGKLSAHEAMRERDEIAKQQKRFVNQSCQTSDAVQRNLNHKASSEEVSSSHKKNPVSLDPRYLERHPRSLMHTDNDCQEEVLVRNIGHWKPFSANVT